MSFSGLRVLSLESRRATEMAQLIRSRQGDPFVAPSMREVPLDRNEDAFQFAERLFAGEFDMLILLTGVGTRLLNRVLATRYPPEQFAEALRSITVVARGPKPIAVLRELRVPVTVAVPEPNTWRELLAAIADRPERRIALQEYGRPNSELLEGLRRWGAGVTPVRVYDWDLPEDVGPLREAASRIASGQFDVALFTTSVQVDHLLRVAAALSLEDPVRTGLSRMVIASIGPTTTAALQEHGIRPDFEPSHPKMGYLVQETADRAIQLVQSKK